MGIRIQKRKLKRAVKRAKRSYKHYHDTEIDMIFCIELCELIKSGHFDKEGFEILLRDLDKKIEKGIGHEKLGKRK